MKKASTATERHCPQGMPRARGTEPMAACTVALGQVGDDAEQPFFAVRGVPQQAQADAQTPEHQRQQNQGDRASPSQV
jgi:hypothetical protein